MTVRQGRSADRRVDTPSSHDFSAPSVAYDWSSVAQQQDHSVSTEIVSEANHIQERERGGTHSD